MANIGAIIPGVLGLGSTIAGAIPNLRKPKRTDSGRRAAAQAAQRGANIAVGASQTGRGASRGLALREGLRAASQVTSEAAPAIAEAAARDEQAFQAQLQARRGRIEEFTKALGGGLSQVGQAAIQPAPPEAGAQQGDLVQAQPELQEDPTGLGPAAGAQQVGLTEQIDPATGGPDLAQLEADAGAGPTASFQAGFDPVAEAVGIGPAMRKQQLEIDLENKLSMKNLMLREAERQGVPLGNVLAQTNRRLGLQPGQDLDNPFGTQFDLALGEQ